MLLGLRHRTVGCSNNKDGTIHLCSTGDHVLDVVSVAWSVYVCVVALLGLVFNVRDVDGNTALLLLWGVVNLVERV